MSETRMIRVRIYCGTTLLPPRFATDEEQTVDAIDIRMQSDNERAVECILERLELGRASKDGPRRRLERHRYRLVTLEEIKSTDVEVDLIEEAEVVELPSGS